MKITLNKLGFLLLLLVAAGSSSAGFEPVRLRPAIGSEKPDFSGRWTFSKEKSRLQAAWAAGMESGIVRIDHREPHFTFDRTFIINGKESHSSYTMTTDGKEVVAEKGARKEISRMYWEGDILVLSDLVDGPLGEATNVVHYRLAEQGRVLLAIERATGPQKYENQWVFERTSSTRESGEKP